MKIYSVRLLSFAMAIALFFTSIPFASAYGKLSPWAEEEISQMDELGLIPDALENADLTKKINRLNMCRIAVISYETLTGKTIPLPYEHPFPDTKDPDVEKAHLAKLIDGRDDGKFYPDDVLTRSEFFAFVSKFLNAVGYPVKDSDYADLSRFDDAKSIPKWVEKSAQITVGLNIVRGTGTSLDWSAKTTAEQALVMFLRTYNTAFTADLDTPELVMPPKPFENLSGWAEETVMEMYDLGLIPNSVKYSNMTGPITRGNMCHIAVLSYCELTGTAVSDLGSAGTPFKDTDDPYIALAHKLGIVNGYSDGTFRPNNPITRQEYFKIAVNFLNAVDYPVTDDPNVDLSKFKDEAQLAQYAKPCARLLVGLGIIKGDDTKKLNPTAQIICQEALVIFMRIIDFMESDPVIPDDPGEDKVPDNTEPPTPPVLQPHPNLNKAHAVVEKALTYLGYPYVYGGASPDKGFDCSGFAFYIYKQFGYSLYRSSKDQWKVSDTVIAKNNLMPGDLLFFSSNGASSGIFHVGIYIEDGKFIHAENARTGVVITNLSQNYYAQRFIGGKRVIK